MLPSSSLIGGEMIEAQGLYQSVQYPHIIALAVDLKALALTLVHPLAGL